MLGFIQIDKYFKIEVFKDLLFKKIIFTLNFYLFLERGERRERERKTSMCGCLLRVPYWGPGQQPRHAL